MIPLTCTSKRKANRNKATSFVGIVVQRPPYFKVSKWLLRKESYISVRFTMFGLGSNITYVLVLIALCNILKASILGDCINVNK